MTCFLYTALYITKLPHNVYRNLLPKNFCSISSITVLHHVITLSHHNNKYVYVHTTTDGDVRVVVSASLRRMVPPMLRDLSREEVDLCLSSILAHIPTLMEDHAPIPQYTLRLLCEVIKTSPYAVHVITSRYD